MSIRQLIFFAACLTNFSLAAQTLTPAMPVPAAPLSLVQTLEVAKQNAASRMSQQDLAAANSDILAANRAPLPTFSAKTSATDNSGQASVTAGNLTPQRRTDKSWGLDWTLERGGKRTHRTDAAKLNAQAAQAEFAETQIQQQLLAKDLYFELLAAQERTQHLKAIAQSAETSANAAKLRAKAGDLSAQDMMRVEIEAEHALSDLRKAQLDEKRAGYVLSQNLGLNPSNGQKLSVTADWPQASSLALEQSQSLEAWITARPDVQAFQLRAQASQALLDNAKALGKIDPTIGLSVDSNPGTNKRLTELRVQFPLQVGSTYDGEIGRATAQSFQAQTQWDQAKLNAEAEWLSMREAYAASMARYTIYMQEILPRAHKVATQAELAYTKGAIPLVDLLDARRTLKNSLLEAVEVKAEHAKTFIALQLRAPKL
ncbi:MAG: TolC family protein [Betaproteobacteria bacterium]